MATKARAKATPGGARQRLPKIGVPLSANDELRLIDRGVPVGLARDLKDEMGLTQQRFAAMLGIANRTLIEHMKQSRLTADESDRVLRAKRVYEQAVEVFEGEQEAALDWFETPLRSLDGRAPIDLVATSTGTTAIENTLAAMEHGIYA